jgi:iron(III) transport system ATP-binding protein
MGDQVAVLRQGRLVQVADPQTLYRRPVDADLARFLGEAIVLPGVAQNGVATCALGTLDLGDAKPTGEVDVLIRPEQVRLDSTAILRARVADVTFYGHDASVRLRLKAGGPDLVTARVHGHAAPQPGQEVGLVVDGIVVAWPRSPASAGPTAG